ncbi:MAG: MBL fold metallo-hydrolase [Polyangiaceae bacterium]
MRGLVARIGGAVVLSACCPSLPPPTEITAVPEAQQRAEAGACREQGVALQILGSGGPIPDDARASSGYLLWQDGKARAMIDAGGGTFLRFGEAKARIADLDVIALSHLHADHAADLAAFFKGGYFAERKRALTILGPTEGGRFPGIDGFVTSLLDPEHGAFRYLSGYLDGSLFRLDVRPIDPSAEAAEVFTAGDLSLRAVGVKHAQIPALGFVATIAGKRVAFTGDQNAESKAFVELARGADLLVAHHAISLADEDLRHLHRTPEEIAQLAAEAEVHKLVLSHNMQRALADLMRSLELMRSIYHGPIEVGDDLGCYPLAEPVAAAAP